MNELETLIPQAIDLEIAGEKLVILPLTIGQLGLVMRAIKPALAELVADEINMIEVATEHTGSLANAVAGATGKPLEWVNGLNLADFIRLAGKLWEVNKDFFTRAVLPEIERVAASVKVNGVETAAAGPTPSKP